MQLRAQDLSIGYRNHLVGSDIALSLEAGEVLCLLGPNGAGKTTLFRTLLGLQRALAGRVLLDDRVIERMRPVEIARHMAYVPQAHATEFSYTVLDVVLMGRTAHLSPFAAPSARDVAIADACLAKLGLASLADQVYTRVSGGERQLALIARALAQQAPLIVMDEPTASLDFGNQARVLDEVRALAASGIGVIMATHDPDQAFLCADRVALLHAGKLVIDAPPREAITPATMREVYGIDADVLDVTLASGETRRVCVPRSRA